MSKLKQLAERIKQRRYEPHGDELREGQLTYIAVADVDKELYNKLLGTEADCFFDNNKIPALYEAAIKHWGNE